MLVLRDFGLRPMQLDKIITYIPHLPHPNYRAELKTKLIEFRASATACGTYAEESKTTFKGYERSLVQLRQAITDRPPPPPPPPALGVVDLPAMNPAPTLVILPMEASDWFDMF